MSRPWPLTLPGVPATGQAFPPHPPWSPPQFLDEPLPTIHHWTSQQVGQWLHSLNLEQYAAEFAARQVDGPQLLQLDGSKLKVGQSRGHPSRIGFPSPDLVIPTALTPDA